MLFSQRAGRGQTRLESTSRSGRNRDALQVPDPAAWDGLCPSETIARHGNPGPTLVNHAEIEAAHALSRGGPGNYYARRRFQAMEEIQAGEEGSEAAPAELRAIQAGRPSRPVSS